MQAKYDTRTERERERERERDSMEIVTHTFVCQFTTCVSVRVSVSDFAA